jgi:hypothetical protein
VLSVDPQQGRVFEVSRGTKDEVVWEFVNLAEPSWAGQVVDVHRVQPSDLRFLDQSCS